MTNKTELECSNAANRRKCLWFAFQGLQSQVKKSKSPTLHQSRDGGSAELIACVLGSLDYLPGATIFNYPGHDFRDLDPKLLGSNQMLLITTRPPLDPFQRKPVDCSGSSLERKVFDCFRTFLAYCSRSTIELTERVEQALNDNKRYLVRTDFSVYSGGSTAGDPSETQPNKSLGYMISASAVWPNGPRLFAVFGAAGTESLAWAYILATNHRNVIKIAVESDRDMIAIGEFALPGGHLDRQGSLSFLDKVKPELTVCELENGVGSPTSRDAIRSGQP